MSESIRPGTRLAVIGSCQAYLDNWEKRVAATVKESLTVQCAGPRERGVA